MEQLYWHPHKAALQVKIFTLLCLFKMLSKALLTSKQCIIFCPSRHTVITLSAVLSVLSEANSREGIGICAITMHLSPSTWFKSQAGIAHKKCTKSDKCVKWYVWAISLLAKQVVWVGSWTLVDGEVSYFIHTPYIPGW